MTKEEKRKEYQKLYNQMYYARNKVHLNAKQKEYNNSHKEELQVYYKNWYNYNKKMVSERNRAYYQAHKLELKAKRIAKQFSIK